jgi:hypothetical protein
MKHRNIQSVLEFYSIFQNIHHSTHRKKLSCFLVDSQKPGSFQVTFHGQQRGDEKGAFRGNNAPKRRA